jgi:hypothetical protein
VRLSAGGFEATALCAIGERVGETIYLAYLSLLGPGTTVVALWATLMDHRNAHATLEDDAGVLGRVQLWQRRPDLADLGYHLSWRRRHAVLPRAHGARLIHLVTEPDLLTCRDPEQVESGRSSRRRRSGSKDQKELEGERGGATGRAHSESPGGSHGVSHSGVSAPSQSRSGKGTPSVASDATSGGPTSAEISGQEVAEQVARETRPLFLLLQTRDEDHHALARRHLLFLAERVQWLAYYEPWADALWERAVATGEAVPLTIWPSRETSEDLSPNEPEMAGADGQRLEDHLEASTWIVHAWLCRPHPLKLATALQALIAGGDRQTQAQEERSWQD